MRNSQSIPQHFSRKHAPHKNRTCNVKIINSHHLNLYQLVYTSIDKWCITLCASWLFVIMKSLPQMQHFSSSHIETNKYYKKVRWIKWEPYLFGGQSCYISELFAYTLERRLSLWFDVNFGWNTRSQNCGCGQIKDLWRIFVKHAHNL